MGLHVCGKMVRHHLHFKRIVPGLPISMSGFPLAYFAKIGLPYVSIRNSVGHTAIANVSVPQGGVALKDALDDALCSALTKFDTLEAQFGCGRSVKDVADMLVEELLGDVDLAPVLVGSEPVETLQRHIRTHVGKTYGEWKKRNSNKVESKDAVKRQEVPLPWASIDAYPEWVMTQIELCVKAEPEEHDAACKFLEHIFLTKPILSGSIKYDGTCFGKLDNGDLCGRKEVLGSLCSEYQRTSTGSSESCDAEELKGLLSEMLGIAVARLCVWGELMCNPNFYGYRDRGLDAKWVCFGVVATFDQPDFSLSEKLKSYGLAHSLNREGTKVRLMTCPALQELLRRVGVVHVALDEFTGLTHAEVVSKGYGALLRGENEGLVIVFEGAHGQASIRKWKNSSEGATARKKEALALQECYLQCKDLCARGRLDSRVADMVDTLRSVAAAETNPVKKGRDKTSKKPV